MAWTEEMVEELKRLWDEGVTTGEIGRRLNISKNSIVGKVHRLGLSGRPSPIKKKSDTPTDKPAEKKQPKEKSPKKSSVSKEIKPIKNTTKETSTPKTVSAPAPKKESKIEVKAAPVTFTIEPEEDDIALAKSLNTPIVEKEKKEFLRLTDLDNHTCRWPIGDPKDDNFHFCGHKVRLGQTYCEEHSAVAYVKPNKK